MLKYSECVQDRSKLLKYVWISQWEHKEDMTYYLSYYHKNEKIIIPKWTRTDLASSPNIAHWIIPREKYMSAVIHDYLYSGEGIIIISKWINLSQKFKRLEKYWYWINETSFKPNRKFIDLLFYYGMIEENIMNVENMRWKPLIWYIFVRLFWKINQKWKI